MLNAREVSSVSSFKRHPAIEPGAYPGRVVMVANIGVQTQRDFKGETKPPRMELLVTYELLDEFLKDEDGNDDLEKPRWMSERFGFSNLESDRATSTKRYYALDADEVYGGDWLQLISTPCMVNVVNYTNKNKEIRDKISNVSSMRPKEASKAPPLLNTPVTFDFYSPDLESLQALPKWVRKVISEAVNYEGSRVEALMSQVVEDRIKEDLSNDLDDEIPFDPPAVPNKERVQPVKNSRSKKIEDDWD